MRRFISPVLPKQGGKIILDSEVSHHILRVVGIAPLEKFELGDGQGQVCIVSLLGVQEGRAEVQWEEEYLRTSEASIVWVGLALTKRDAFSTALRMLTEVGVEHIVPLHAERSIAKGEKKERWEKILQAASAQSKREVFPTLHPLQNFEQGLEYLKEIPQRWILHTSQEPCFLKANSSESAILIGPEGGFSPKEVSMAIEKGWTIASLSPFVLRADTAAIVASSLLLQN